LGGFAYFPGADDHRLNYNFGQSVLEPRSPPEEEKVETLDKL
jgi:hypothetical protein